MLGDDFEPFDQKLRPDLRLERFEEERVTALLFRVLLALVADGQDDQHLAVALGEVVVERLEHRRRQRFVLDARVDQLVAPFDDRLEQVAHSLHEVGAFLDDIRPRDGEHIDLLAGPHAD